MGRRTWYTFYPMLAVMAVTLTSLVPPLLERRNSGEGGRVGMETMPHHELELGRSAGGMLP